MTSREARRPPPPRRRALLLLAPLALLGTLLLGLLAQGALADHAVEPPTGLTVAPAPVDTSTSPSWSFQVPTGHTAACALTGPAGPVAVTCPAEGGTAGPVQALTTDGQYAFSVTSTRPDVEDPSDSSTVHVGGTSEPATSSYTLDRVAPALSVSPPPPGSYTGWSLGVSDATAVTLACALTGPSTPGFTCNPGNVSPALSAEGDYLLSVTATDAAGNASTASAAYTYDTTAPTVTITGLPPGRDTTPTWGFTIGTGGGPPTCTLTGPGVSGTGSCGPSSYTAAELTASGSYTLTVSSTDGSGNTGTASSTYVLDITPPAVTITPPGDTSGTGPTQTWTVDVGDATSATCRVDGVVVSCSEAITGERLTDGTVRLTVEASDAVGNQATATASYTRSSTPTAPLVSAPPSPASAKTVTWTFSTDALTTAVSCRLTRGGSTVVPTGACTSFAAGEGSFTATLTDDGTYTLHVTASNTSSPGTATGTAAYTLDATEPDGPVLTAVHAGTTGNASPLTWTWTTLTGHSTQCRLTVAGAAGSWAACAGSFTVTPTAQGSYLLEVRYADALGNTGTPSSASYLYDSVGPAAPVVTLIGESPRQPGEVTWSVSTSPDVARTECRVIGPGVLASSVPWATCSLPVVRSLTGDGSHELQVRQLDSAGNRSDVVSSTVVLDGTPPSAPAFSGSGTRGTDPALTWTFSQTGDGTSFRCRLLHDGVATAAFTACTSGYAVTVTADGSYQLQVVAVDAVGNVSAVSSGPVHVVDRTGPAAPAVVLAVTGGSTPSATWAVTPAESGTTSQCRLTRTAGGVTTELLAWSACTGYTFALTAGDGVYVLHVRTLDDLGNLGAATTGPGYTLDTTPPAQPTVTGSRSGTGNDRAVSYAFEGEGTATCRLWRDGAHVSTTTGCQLPQPYGVTLPAVDGTYTLQVTFTDSFGNVSTPGASQPYTLDLTPPATPTVVGSRSGAGNEREISYAFTGEGTASCQLTRDGTAVGTAVPCTGPWAVTLPAVDGSYVLLVTFTDAVGNVGAPGASQPYVLDLTPPPAPAVLGPGGTGNKRTVSWAFSGEGTATCTLLLDGAAHSGPVAGCVSGHTLTLPADGAWSLRVTYTDAVGNTGPPGVSPVYLLDTVPPAAPRLSGPTGPAQSRAPTWSVVTDADSTTECRLVRAGTPVSDWAACAGTAVGDLTGLPDGAYVLEARATDRAGNASPVGTSAPYVLDTTAPAAPVVSGPTGPSQARTPSFSWTGEAGARAECRLSRDGTAVGGWVACSSGYSPSLDRDGTWMLGVRLVDAAGNVGAVSVSAGYVLDTTPPPTPAVLPPKTPGRDTAPSWGATVEDGSTVECRLTGPEQVTSPWAACSLPLVTPLAGRPDGSYLLEVRATDAAGNVSAVGRGTYLLDTLAPEAAAVTSPAGPGRSRSPSFSFTVEPGATTSCRLTSGATLVQDFLPCTSPASLDLTGLPDGTYTLTVRVTDAAGNPGPAATGSYVLDTAAPAAPVLTLSPASPAPTRRLTWAFTHEPGGALQCRLTSPTGAVRDLAGCTSPLTVDLTGSPDGTYTLTVRAVDAAGNVGAALTLTHVLDSAAAAGPTVTGPSTPGSTRTPTWTLGGGTTECRLTRGTTVVRDWFACAGGSWTADLFGQPDGTYSLSVRLRTSSGVSAATVSSYLLDTTAPAAATVVAPPTPSTNRRPTWSIASPELGARAECRVLVFGSVLRDWAPCAVSLAGALHAVDLAGLGDGRYTLVVRLLDAAGNPGPEASSAYVLDTSAPVAVGVTGPPSPGNDPTPTWRLSSGSGATLECRLTAAAGIVQDWTPCAGEFTADLTQRTDGTYTLHVRALSQAGTPGPESSSDYVLSRQPPGGVLGLSLSGTSSPGKSRHPTWTFTLPQGSTGWCTVTSAGRVVRDGPCTSPLVLDLSRAADGDYTLTVRAVSAAGVLGAPATSTYTLDTQPTERPVLTLTPGETGSSLDPQWRFTVVYGATAQCRLLHDGRVSEDWFDCATGTFTGFLTGRPDGRYTLEVRARDAAGNTSEPQAHTYRLDRAAPAVAGFAGVPATPSQERVVRWTFSAPEGTALECRVVAPDGVTAWTACGELAVTVRSLSPQTMTVGSYRLDLSGRPDGLYVLEVRVVEADGRRGSVSRASYVLDRTPPARPAFTSRPAPAGNAPSAEWSWSAGDERVECRLTRDGAVLSDWKPCSSPFQVDLAKLGDATYVLSIRVIDAAGNASDVTSSAYLLDTRPPARPVFTSSPTSGSDRTVSWTFTVPAGTTASCRVTRGVTVVVREASCGGRYDLNLVGLPDGVYTLTVTYRDSAGNLGTPATDHYALTTSRTGPIRVDPPPPAGPAPGGGGAAPPPAPGRGGTGVVVPAPQGSTPAPGVPTIPSDADVPVASAGRPRTFAPSTPREEVAQDQAEQETGAAPRSRNPLPPLDFPTDVLRDVVTGTITRPTLPLAMLAIVVLFLLAQNRIDRRDPKLASAPVEAEPELDFTVFIRRPGGALP